MLKYIYMGNTVGSTNSNFCNFPRNNFESYILGLWCADGFIRTSSVGISNTDIDLIKIFYKFLANKFTKNRLRLVIYGNNKLMRNKYLHLKGVVDTHSFSKKAKHIGYHLYVNSRSLVRALAKLKASPSRAINSNNIYAYFAGRFDGDGSISLDFHRDCRISYGSKLQAQIDFKMLRISGYKLAKVYEYRKAKTYVLYVSRYECLKFLSNIYRYSVKLQKLGFVPRRDLISTYKV